MTSPFKTVCCLAAICAFVIAAAQWERHREALEGANLVTTRSGVVIRLDLPKDSDGLNRQDQLALWWRGAHWLDDDSKYRDLETETERIIQTSGCIDDKNRFIEAAQPDHPGDPASVFIWALAYRDRYQYPELSVSREAYARAMAPVALAIANCPFPPSARYLRLAFLVAAETHPNPSLRDLAWRLIREFPYDWSVKLASVRVLNSTGSVVDSDAAAGFLQRYSAAQPKDEQAPLSVLQLQLDNMTEFGDIDAKKANQFRGELRSLASKSFDPRVSLKVESIITQFDLKEQWLRSLSPSARKAHVDKARALRADAWNQIQQRKLGMRRDAQVVVVDPCPGGAFAFPGASER